MENPVAQIDHLRKSFNGNDVLKDISLVLHAGENLVVIGKSGCGKSVLIKCLIGLLEADGGNVMLFGKDIATFDAQELNTVRKRVGFLFQSAALYDAMTVRENLEFPLRNLKNVPQSEITDKVREALKNVGLEHAMDKMPSELSGGMRKRVGLARTVIMRPEIILYDEPTTGLDPITSREISRLILDLQTQYNIASIIITHDLECARITGNRMIALRDGLNYAEGTFNEFSTSSDEWLRSFFH